MIKKTMTLKKKKAKMGGVKDKKKTLNKRKGNYAEHLVQ